MHEIVERETMIVDWGATLAWATTHIASATGNVRMTSDGLVYNEFGTVRCEEKTSVVAGFETACGINMKEAEAGAEYTPYQINVAAMFTDPQLMPHLFIGQSTNPPTAALGGDLITRMKVLACATTLGSAGSTLNANITVLVKVDGTQKICFGIAMEGNNASPVSKRASMVLSVRRLIGVNPAVIDTRKL